MKFTSVSAVAAMATAVAAAPAVVSVVTEHVHIQPTETVRGIIFFENGNPVTSFTTINDNVAATTAAAAATSAAAAVVNDNVNANQLVAAENVQEDATTAAAAAAAATTPVAAAAVEATTPAATVAPVTSAQAEVTSSSAVAVPAATTAAAQDGLSDFASTMLNEHNAKRALHQDTAALTWSDSLADYAQNYANQYDCSGSLTHSGGPYGENLALGYSPAGSVDTWYNEISSYDWSNPGFSEAAGHFTQVVWKGSSQVGCGIKQCNNEWGSYVICSYSAPGNYIGEFADNVEPLA